MNHRRQAFTLVELLVVLAVVALLVALLLPALRQSREQANRLRCLANIRQQGVAILSYTNEYGDRLPNGGETDGDYNACHSFEYHAATSLIDDYTNGDGRIWCCPEFTRFGVAPPSPAAARALLIDNPPGAASGGGYAHRLPVLNPVDIPGSNYLEESDPRNASYIKAHMPHLNVVDPLNGTYPFIGNPSLSLVVGTWLLMSENDCAPGDWFGDPRHLAGAGIKPDGGSMLWSDGSAKWSKNMVQYPNGDWDIISDGF